MRIPCRIQTYSRLKKNMKLVITIEDKDCADLARFLDSCVDKPLLIDLGTDIEKQKRELLEITPEQRAYIFSIIKDIAEWSGDDKESMRSQLSGMFCEEMQIEEFSLSNCMTDTATAFIEWLIKFAFENGVSMTVHPKEGLNDVEKYVAACVANSKCICCGGEGIVYEKNSTGRPVCLCDKHLDELKGMGMDKFNAKYHFSGQ